MRPDAMLHCIFSAETRDFREPEEPDVGDLVTVRLRVERGLASSASIVFSTGAVIPLKIASETDPFAWYETCFTCPEKVLRYRFVVATDDGDVVCQRFRCVWGEEAGDALGRDDFLVVPGFHVPTWSKGALQYQIFPDRFYNADETNDVVAAEYAYGGLQVMGTLDWGAPLTMDDFRCFRGGDLAGILEKLDYLVSLGIEAVYLNPIFTSPSSHKYDVQDYLAVDPHLGVIVRDGGACLDAGDLDNAHATRYALRTTAPENIEASNALFARLCAELHRRHMRVIVDGVFNHSGMNCRWMDRSAVYGGRTGEGAYWSLDSPYRCYYRFKGEKPKAGYESWGGFDTLPKLNYEGSAELQRIIVDVARHWVAPPYAIDGWRLDVAAELGHTRSINHAFWRRFRAGVKDTNREAVIVAEHYGPVASWFDGTQWDTIMNYDAFMEPLTFFLTGMEKHSDERREDLYLDGEAFFDSILDASCEFPWTSLLSAMNELSNHDHSRFLTRTNGVVGRMHTMGQKAAGDGTDLAVMRQAVAVQMTWPGAPTIYYGDEAGLVGWTDPDNRRPFPWDSSDEDLIEYHRTFARLRGCHPSLRTGALVPLGYGQGWIAFGRFLEDDWVAVLINALDESKTATVRLRSLGVTDDSEMMILVASTRAGVALDVEGACVVRDGIVTLMLPPGSAYVLGACARHAR